MILMNKKWQFANHEQFLSGNINFTLTSIYQSEAFNFLGLLDWAGDGGAGALRTRITSKNNITFQTRGGNKEDV